MHRMADWHLDTLRYDTLRYVAYMILAELRVPTLDTLNQQHSWLAIITRCTTLVNTGLLPSHAYGGNTRGGKQTCLHSTRVAD